MNAIAALSFNFRNFVRTFFSGFQLLIKAPYLILLCLNFPLRFFIYILCMCVLDLTVFFNFMIRFNQLSNPKLLLCQGLFKLYHPLLLGIDLIFQLLHQYFL